MPKEQKTTATTGMVVMVANKPTSAPPLTRASHPMATPWLFVIAGRARRNFVTTVTCPKSNPYILIFYFLSVRVYKANKEKNCIGHFLPSYKSVDYNYNIIIIIIIKYSYSFILHSYTSFIKTRSCLEEKCNQFFL